jgi:hypothetical protein
LSSATPAALGTAAAGVGTNASRDDHVHSNTIDTIVASGGTATTAIHGAVTTGSITVGAGLTTGTLNLAAAGTGATNINIGHTNATITLVGSIDTPIVSAAVLGTTAAGVVQAQSTTGSGNVVLATSPTFATSVQGTASMDVFNTTSTTVNAFGAATALTMGATTGTTSIRNSLDLAAGTTSLAPLAFASGTNKTSPAAGDIEFDGTRLYATTNASTSRGKLGIVHAYRRSSTASVTNPTTVSIGAGIPVESSTVYAFKAFIYATASGVTSSTLSFLFANAGTGATALYQWRTTSVNTLAYQGASTAVTATVITDSVTGSPSRFITIEGFVFTGTSAGTLTPQFQSSSGTWTLQIGCQIELEKIGGTSTTTIAGAWA